MKNSFFSEPLTYWENAFLKTFITDEFWNSEGIWKGLLYAIYVASILDLKYLLIIDDTYIYEYILNRTEFDSLYEITFIGRESAKHLLESNY